MSEAEAKRALILDSTQIDAYLTCPRYWYYGHAKQLVRADAEPPRPIMMGTYGHKLLEIYYKAKLDGSCTNLSQSIDKVLSFNPPINILPLEPTDREAVKKAFRLYAYTYSASDIKPLMEDTVEIGFSHKLYEDDSWIYILEGRIDLIGTLIGETLFMDHKFQLRSKNLYKKAIQFRNYALASDKLLGVINYIRLTKEVTKDTFNRELISFTKPELAWWRCELISIYHNIRESIESAHYKQNWSACSGKYGYECEFTQLCEERSIESRKVRESAFYKIKEEWKPW